MPTASRGPSAGSRVLVLLHFVYSLFLVLISWWNRIRGLALRFGGSSDTERVRTRTAGFRKVPSHMALVLGPENVSYRDVVKLIEWCLPAGIRVISLYDYRNGINPNAVFESVCKLSKPRVQNIKWGKSFGQEIKDESKKQINGYLWKPKLTVNVFRSKDGLESLLDVVTELHDSGIKRVDRDHVNDLMSKRISSLGEPELAVVCGHGLSYYGFLPWHLRITQFLSLDSHHNITVEKFLNLLEEYSNCEQRFGK